MESFQKVNQSFLKKKIFPKYFDSIALRGNIKSLECSDISIYLGSNFHFVVYPLNQNNEYNFISVIRKNLKKEEAIDKNYFKNNELLKSLVNEISSKTSFDFKYKLENLKCFPIFISKKFDKPKIKNLFFAGDALYSIPPSFAQGAAQSIEASKEVYEEIENHTNNYYQKRYTKIKSVNSRSMLNHFAFHLSNPLTIIIRNFFLKFLTKNKRFLEYYLGKIYKN